MSLFLSLLPALVAISLALLTRRVLASLAAGVLTGALVAAERGGLESVPALLRYLSDAVLPHDAASGFDWSHLVIAAFSLLVAAMVAILSEAGATEALVRRIARLARGRRGAMIASWLAGAVVFFDDYANCLVVGSAMGPLCDRAGVSRAKLAYIVDSTAAPIASLAVVSTWVGYEIGLLDSALGAAGAAPTAFAAFVASLPYGFYGLFTLAFVGAIAITGRDFGPMARVEADTRPHEPEPSPSEPSPPEPTDPPTGRGWIAAAAIAVLLGVTFVSLAVDGQRAAGPGAPWFDVLGAADPFQAMLLGSLAGYAVAAALVVALGDLPTRDVGRATVTGARVVVEALGVLFLAWALGNAMGETGAADELTALLVGEGGEASFPAWALPTAVFLVAAATAFSTGTSFGAMAILVPLAVPLAVGLEGPEGGPVLYASIASVLGGAVLGDHASPISDTTVLSALGAGVDLVTHVRTQLPYALTTGTLAIVLGTLPAGLGVSPWWLLPAGLLAIAAVVRFGGRPPARARPLQTSAARNLPVSR